MTAVQERAQEQLAQEITLKHVEPRESRVQRLSTGLLFSIIGALLIFASMHAKGTARIALSDAFDARQLPVISLPATPTIVVCALITILAAVVFFSGRLKGTWSGVLGGLAGVALLLGFVAWAAADSVAAFTLTNQMRGTMAYAIPLVFGALCGVFSERAGVVNIAIEGQMLTAAFTASVVGSVTQSITMALIAAMLSSVGMAAVLALFALRYLVDHVVLGVVINLLASGLTGFLFKQLVQPNVELFKRVPLMEAIPIPVLADVPFIGPILFNQNVLIYLGYLAVPLAWFLLYKTKWGLRVRAVGEHPHAADTVGINVIRTKWSSLLIGGLLAGLGGAFFTVAQTGRFEADLTVGNGFIALAALIMGRWHPVWAAIMALFFGFVQQLGQTVTSLGAPVSSEVLDMLPYIATIIAVAGLVGRVRAPAADGEHFVKS